MSKLSPLRRGIALVALAALLALPSGLAEARLGGGSGSKGGANMGSRGTRTYEAPATTPTSPRAAAPIERSMTPDRPQPAPGAEPRFNPAPAAPGGFFSGRGGFFSGLMGGLIGAGIGSLLFGHGLFGGIDGIGSIIGLLLQIALIVFLARLLIGFLRNRAASPAGPGRGFGQIFGGPSGPANSGPANSGLAGGFGGSGGGPRPGTQGNAGKPRVRDEVGITQQDLDAFEHILVETQTAWGHGDLAALKRRVTPEMLSYFAEQLAEAASRNVENRISDVRLLQGDLAESWREGNTDYATVAMRFSMTDCTVDRTTGRVVEGDPNLPVEATEIWTFLRSSGGQWLLSAIQQA
jgi:predicted lipid-binding transport protein (Tim44 family)